MAIIKSVSVPTFAVRHSSEWGRAFFLGLLFLFFLPLVGCTSLGERLSTDQLPLGTGAKQVYFIRTDDGWDVVSRIVNKGDGGMSGQRCAYSKQLKINPTLAANIIPVRASCANTSFSADELKWLEFVAQYYAAAVADSPVLAQFYADLGPIEFDWYVIEEEVQFTLEARSTMRPRVSPRLSTNMTLPSAEANNEARQFNLGIGVSGITHEYFHSLVRREGLEFESASAEETVAYLLDHAASIEFGLGYTPTPRAYLEKPLDSVWQEAQAPNLGALDSSIAGLRVAFVMVEKARKCPLRAAAVRGTARIAYEFIREHKAMKLSDLRQINGLLCEELEARGNGGLKF